MIVNYKTLLIKQLTVVGIEGLLQPISYTG